MEPGIGIVEMAKRMGVGPKRANQMLAAGLDTILGAVNTGDEHYPSWWVPRAAFERYMAGDLAAMPLDDAEFAEKVAARVAAILAGKALVFAREQTR